MNRINITPNSQKTGHRLARGIALSLFGTIASRGLAVLNMVLAARILGKEGFGKLDIITSTVAIFQVFAGFGLGLIAVKYVSEFRTTEPDRAGRIIKLSERIALITGGLSATLLAAFASWFANACLGDGSLENLLRIGSISIFFASMNGAQTGALTGFEAFGVIARTNVIGGIVSFPIMLVGVKFFGIAGSVWGLAINQLITWIISHIALASVAKDNGVNLRAQQFDNEFELILKFAIPAVLSDVLVAPVNWACRAMLAHQPDGFSQLGILAASVQIAMVINSLSNVMSAPIIPILSQRRTQADSDSIKYYNVLLYWIVSLIIALPLMAIPELVEWLFGKGFSGPSASRVLVLVLLYTTVNSYKRGLGNAMIVNGNMWWSLASNSLWGAILLSCFYTTIGWGALGMAFSMLVAYTISALVFVPLYLRTGLVPKGILASGASLTIWIATTAVAAASLLMLKLTLRLFLLILATAAIWAAVNVMMNRTEKKET